MKLEEGMLFTIEPMINTGTWQVKILPMAGQLSPEIAAFPHSLNILLVSPQMVLRYSPPRLPGCTARPIHEHRFMIASNKLKNCTR